MRSGSMAMHGFKRFMHMINAWELDVGSINIHDLRSYLKYRALACA